MISRRFFPVFALLGSLLWLNPALAAPRVVASIQPLQSLAAMLLDGLGEAELLLEASQSPHGFSLTPSQMRKLKAADLIIWVGPELERPLARVLEGKDKPRQLLLMQEPSLLLLSGHEHDHDHDHEEAGHDQHEHQHEDGDHDPHLWLSPENGRRILARLAELLAELDPANASHYQAQAAEGRAQLEALDAELKAQLAPVQDKAYMVYHHAYGYFEQHYGLKSLGAITLNPEQPLGAASVKALREQLWAGNARCLFVEPQFSPRLGERLAEAAGVRLGQLDPIGADITPGKSAYPELLRRLAASFVNCLQE